MILKLINKIRNFFLRFWRRRTISKALKQSKKPFKELLLERRQLGKDIRNFLRDYFGLNANSKYIPKDFKNKEEVRVAVLEKFAPKMKELNVNYEDLFR